MAKLSLSSIADPDELTGKVEHEGIELDVRSIDSTDYSTFVRREMRKNIMREKVEDITLKEEDEIDRKGAAHLVESWNLEDELTIENVMELLRKKRAFQNKIYIEANRLGKSEATTSQNSTATPKPGNGSRSRKTQKTKTQ
ncbi:MAG: hypothetical protein ACPHUL_00050 [Marinomonas gallaica]